MSPRQHIVLWRRNRLLPPLVATLFALVVLIESDDTLQPEWSARKDRESPVQSRLDTEEAGGTLDSALSGPDALGQMIVARYSGTRPSTAFLGRVRRGEVGGVILFSDNVAAGVKSVRAAVRDLQRAASEGDNPPLLVMTDQEGGKVRRVPGPPSVAPARIGDDGMAYDQGLNTGRLLRELGINVDLAPVADVAGAGSFLGSRVFGASPELVADRACGFAAGLRDGGVAATLKHFPGLGLASANTDEAAVTIAAPADAIRDGYAPYRECGAQPPTLVMVSSARYPALTGESPAVMSATTYKREMRLAEIDAVTISDDLEAAGISSETTPARRSIQAGLDLLLYAQSEATSASAYSQLLADLRSGAIELRSVRDSAARIAHLKARLASS